MVELKSIYYGGNININKNKKEVDKRKNIFDLYHNINVAYVISKDGKDIVCSKNDLKDNFISKSASYKNFGDTSIKKSFSMPPKGPIHEHTFCPFCGNRNLQYHLEDCTGPYNMEILTEQGYIFYRNKINSTFSREELQEIIENDEDIYYQDIYPPRGVQKINDERLSNPNFNNVVQAKYIVEANGTQVIIPVKVTPYYGITVRNVPGDIEFKELSKTLHDKLIINSGRQSDSKVIKDETWITNINGIFNVCGDNENLDLSRVNDRVKYISNEDSLHIYENNYNSLLGTITIKMAYQVPSDSDKRVKAVIIIKRGGSVSIFLSYGSKLSEFSVGMTNFSNKDKKYLTTKYLKTVANNIYNLIFVNNFCIQSDKKQTLIENKIMNTSIPYTKKGSEITYKSNIPSINAPPQPSGCQNKGLTRESVTKVMIKRPVPFSFRDGVAPGRNLLVKTEGIKSTGAKLKGDRRDLVEPCTEPISGKEGVTRLFNNIKYSDDNDIITQSKFEKMFDMDNFHDSLDDLLEELNEYIGESQGVREKFFRRIMFGFPNNLYTEDSAEFNKIKEGIEIIPDIDTDKTLSSKKVTKTKKIVQKDINSAVYIPGTQLKNFGGNNKFQRDYRQFDGLMKFANEQGRPILMEIIRRSLYSKYIQPSGNIVKPLPYSEKYNNTITHYIIVPKHSDYMKFDEIICYNLDNMFYIVDKIDKNESYETRIEKCKIDEGICILPNHLDENIETLQEKLLDDQLLILIDSNSKNMKLYEYGRKFSWYIRNSIFKFHVTRENDNFVSLKMVDNEELPEYIKELLFEDKDKNLMLFVPKSSVKKISSDGIYNFYINYYIDNEEYYNIVPNQPFILLENFIRENKKNVYKIVSPKENDPTREILEYLLNEN